VSCATWTSRRIRFGSQRGIRRRRPIVTESTGRDASPVIAGSSCDEAIQGPRDAAPGIFAALAMTAGSWLVYFWASPYCRSQMAGRISAPRPGLDQGGIWSRLSPTRSHRRAARQHHFAPGLPDDSSRWARCKTVNAPPISAGPNWFSPFGGRLLTAPVMRRSYCGQ
jgi:hypothetical protein